MFQNTYPLLMLWRVVKSTFKSIHLYFLYFNSGKFAPLTADRFAVEHFYGRSLEDWLLKRDRGHGLLSQESRLVDLGTWSMCVRVNVVDMV